ncbi:MAG: hypothetical protein AAF382_03280 [Pseudomonadota bacterium]
MAQTTHTITHRMGSICRGVTVSLIAGVCRWRSFDEIDTSLKTRPVPNQAMIIAGVIAALFALSLLAGYFGWIGLLVFWLIVIVLVN